MDCISYTEKSVFILTKAYISYVTLTSASAPIRIYGVGYGLSCDLLPDAVLGMSVPVRGLYYLLFFNVTTIMYAYIMNLAFSIRTPLAFTTPSKLLDTWSMDLVNVFESCP